MNKILKDAEAARDHEPAGWHSATSLRRAGWCGRQIALLGVPERLLPNPLFRAGKPMKLWSSATILKTAASREFMDLVRSPEQLKALKAAAAKAQATRAANLRKQVAILSVGVRILPRDVLERLAAQSFGEDARTRANHGISRSRLEQVQVNYIRNHLIDYEPYGLPAVPARFRGAIFAKTLQAIAENYPYLAAECERQLRGYSTQLAA